MKERNYTEMDYAAFKEAVMEDIREVFPAEEYIVKTVENSLASRNTDHLLCRKKPSKEEFKEESDNKVIAVVPGFDLVGLYETFSENASAEEYKRMMAYLTRSYKTAIENDGSTETDVSECVGNISPKAIADVIKKISSGSEEGEDIVKNSVYLEVCKNDSVSEDCIHFGFLGVNYATKLSLTYATGDTISDPSEVSCQFNRSMLNMVNLTEKELIAAAKENTLKFFPVTVENMEEYMTAKTAKMRRAMELLEELSGGENNKKVKDLRDLANLAELTLAFGKEHIDNDENSVLRVSNKHSANVEAYIALPNALSKIAERFEKDFLLSVEDDQSILATEIEGETEEEKERCVKEFIEANTMASRIMGSKTAGNARFYRYNVEFGAVTLVSA